MVLHKQSYINLLSTFINLVSTFYQPFQKIIKPKDIISKIIYTYKFNGI